MTTSFIVRDRVAQNYVDVVLSMFRSWNIDIDVKVEKVDTPAINTSILPFSVGLWEDYDIDDRTLRSKAWGTHKRAAI